MLAGCGDGSKLESTSNSSGTSASSTPTSLSECLSTEKVIAYTVDAVDKSETPDNIYFFEDGKATIIPGEEFGLTMGDFAQMEDDEIWSKYETVRETYVESYKNQMVSDATDSLNEKIQQAQSEIDTVQEIVTQMTNGVDKDYILVCMEELTYMAENYNGDIEDTLWKCIEEEITIQEGIDFFTDKAESVISEKTTTLTQLQTELDGISTTTCATPFCDMPFSFVVETDASGNNVQSESLVYPTLKYSIAGDAPNTFYGSLDFALGLTTQQQIYDTTYNCIALSGSRRFCTRETVETDTVDSKNVLIDLSDDEINELFKDEVMARYE